MKVLMAMTLATVVAILVVPGLVHAQVGNDAAVSITAAGDHLLAGRVDLSIAAAPFVAQPAPGYGYGPYYGPYYGSYPYFDPYLIYDPYYGPYFYLFL